MFTPFMSGKTGIQSQIFLTPEHAFVELHMLFAESMLRAYSLRICQSHMLRDLSFSCSWYVSPVPCSHLADGRHSVSVCEMERHRIHIPKDMQPRKLSSPFRLSYVVLVPGFLLLLSYYVTLGQLIFSGLHLPNTYDWSSKLLVVHKHFKNIILN